MPAESLGVVVAHDDRAVIEQIAGVLEAIPDLFVAATSIDRARAGNVVVAGGEVLFTARHLPHPLVAVAFDDPVRTARAALAAGARELIRWPDESDRLAAAVRRAASNGHAPPGEGVVVAVAGARGGLGTSTTVAALAAGLTRDQIVRIYGFEATGNGSYDVEAGLEYNKHGRAITTALGYNQLLATNSVEILAEKGSEFIRKFDSKWASTSGVEHQSLDGKIDVLRRMIVFARSVPDAWAQHEILANTTKGLAVHALNLDVEVGPILQSQKLLDSVVFARRKGLSRTLSAAELEMMNLTGDGNGFDMVTMPLAWRDQVPTANFFRPSGYANNPVAQRNNVVAKLIAATDVRMDEEIKKPGARELASHLQ